MSEARVKFHAQNPLKPEPKPVIMSTEVDALRGQLRDMKRQIIGLLTTVDSILGDEPSVMTREMRRRG